MGKDERAKWKWEFLRRNKKYIEAFKRDQKTRKGTDRRCGENVTNFRIYGVLLDPDKPYAEDNPFMKELGDHAPQTPFTKNPPVIALGMYTDPDDWDHKTPCTWVYPPNTEIGENDGVRLINGRGKKFKYWVVSKPGSYPATFEKLTMQNCPRTFTMDFAVIPTLQINVYRKEVMRTFDWLWNLIAEAQKSLPQGRSLRTKKPRFSEFQHYVEVYDLRTLNPSMSWSDIAIKLFPEETIKNPAYRRKPRREVLPLPSAKDKVRKYWIQANKMINEEGWKMF